MFTCKPCLSKTNPALADNIPNDQYHTTTCDTCKKSKIECVQIVKEALRPTQSKPLSKPTPDTEPAPTQLKKEKYQYLLIDWDNATNKLCTTKQELIDNIQHHVFELKHKDVEVYKLTLLPHKAEIKVEVGKE